MPKEIEIEVFPMFRTSIDPVMVGKWLDRLGATEFASDAESHECTDPAFAVALAAKRCYMAFEPGLNPNVTRVRSDMVKYFDNLLKSGHGSVLEHASYTFAIEGVSRVFTGEMNRHRAGVGISEGSMRFIRYDEIPFWMPTSIQPAQSDDEDLRHRKSQARDLFRTAFYHMEGWQRQWNAIWDMNNGNHNFDYRKKVTSAGRRLIGMGVATGGIWTLNLRALRHVIALRTEAAAEEEIFMVCGKIAEHMVAAEPMIFQDFNNLRPGSWQPANWKV